MERPKKSPRDEKNTTASARSLPELSTLNLARSNVDGISKLLTTIEKLTAALDGAKKSSYKEAEGDHGLLPKTRMMYLGDKPTTCEKVDEPPSVSIIMLESLPISRTSSRDSNFVPV